MGMSETERVINDLNVAKLILCNPQTLTPEMCIRIGQAITSALALLKEQDTVEHAISVLDAHGWKRDDGEWVNELIQGTKVEQTTDKIVCTVIGRQEARLLTLEEVRKLPSETLLWQEYKNRPYVIPVCLIAVRKQPEELAGEPPEEIIDFGDGCDSTEDYGSYYRLWTAKPTEEQRREAKW